VGKYAIHVEEFEKLVLRYLDPVTTLAGLYVIDEIGKMELLSGRFKIRIIELLDQPTNLLATIAKTGNGFIDQIKRRSDVEIIEVTRNNRDELRILEEKNLIVRKMPGVTRKTEAWNSRGPIGRIAAEDWIYPTGMVWCPMKMSGIAIMKCAELQRDFGCASLRQLRIITTTKPENVPFFWPWLRRGRECPERASEKEVRELRLALSPLRSVAKSRKNPQAYRCPACGGRKAFGARQCRRCWRVSARK
jgi:hypothetical protein